MNFGMHGVGRHYQRVRDLGVTYTRMAADTFADPRFAEDWDLFAASGLDFILDFFTTEDRLTNRAGIWERDVTNTRAGLEQRGILNRCLGIMPATDELYSHVAAAPGVGKWPGLFPAVSKLTPSREVALMMRELLADRCAELARIWGPLPPLGLGFAETGGIVVDPVPNQRLWMLNVYRLEGYWSAEQVDEIYHGVRQMTSPVIPVIPLFADAGATPTSLLELGQLYLPHLDALAAAGRLAGIEFFLYDHPIAGAKGIRQLDGGADGERHAAVRYLVNRYASARLAA